MHVFIFQLYFTLLISSLHVNDPLSKITSFSFVAGAPATISCLEYNVGVNATSITVYERDARDVFFIFIFFVQALCNFVKSAGETEDAQSLFYIASVSAALPECKVGVSSETFVCLFVHLFVCLW